MIRFFLNKIGKSDYIIDKKISSRDLFFIILQRIIMLIRGLLYTAKMPNSNLIKFMGKRIKINFGYKEIKINFGYKVRFAKNLFIGDNVKIMALSVKGIVGGRNVTIRRGTTIDCTGVYSHIGEGLVLGNNVGISDNCFIQVRGKVIIGNDVIIGPNTSIFSENHNFKNTRILIRNQGVSRRGVIIEDNVWIGANVTILDGVKIGKGSVISAGSVVNKNIDDNTVVGGIPARLIKKL